MIFCMHMHSKQNGFLDSCVHSHAKRIEMCNARVHLRSTGITRFLELRMHSHAKKIEMCNACVHLRNTGIIKMGFGFMRALASEEKSNSLSQLENVCFLNICLQSLFVCANLFLSAFPFLFCLLWWWEGKGLRGVGAG